MAYDRFVSPRRFVAYVEITRNVGWEVAGWINLAREKGQVSGCCEHGNEFLDEVRTASFSLNCKDQGPRLSRDSPGYHKELQLSLILSPRAK